MSRVKVSCSKCVGNTSRSHQWHRWLQVTRVGQIWCKGYWGEESWRWWQDGFEHQNMLNRQISTRYFDWAWFHDQHESGTALNVSWSGRGEHPLYHTRPSLGQHPHLSPVTLHETFRDVPGSCRPWNHAQSTYLDESYQLSTFWWSKPSWNHPNEPWPQHPLHPFWTFPSQSTHLSLIAFLILFLAVPGIAGPWNHAQSTYLDEHYTGKRFLRKKKPTSAPQTGK